MVMRRARRPARARGKVRGRGIGHYLEVTADAGNEMGGIRFEEDGTVTIITGTLDYGQGHASPFAQVLSDRLGVPFDKIKLLQGDSDELVAGGGTGGSRSMMQSGGAIVAASDIVIERGKQLAAHFLEAAVEDIEFFRGRFSIAGTDRGIGIMDLAARLRIDGAVAGRRAAHVWTSSHIFKGVPSAFPNGCHIAEVELDPDTGMVEIVSYVTVNDFGVLVNPMLVEGQAHGGIAQGIGQALSESVVYDDDGQMLTGSYMDYGLPRASDVPSLGFESHPVPGAYQSAGCQGLRRSGMRGIAAGRDERAGRCAVGVRHHAYRHAGDASPDLAGDSGGTRGLTSRMALGGLPGRGDLTADARGTGDPVADAPREGMASIRFHRYTRMGIAQRTEEEARMVAGSGIPKFPRDCRTPGSTPPLAGRHQPTPARVAMRGPVFPPMPSG